MKKTVFCLFFAALLFALSVSVSAKETAVELSSSVTVSSSDGRGVSALRDRSRYSYFSVSDTTELIIRSKEPIASLYLEFDRTVSEWTLTELETGKTAVCGGQSFLHEFVDVSRLFGEEKTEFSLTFASSGALAELYVYSSGELPDSVQKWESAEGACDLLLFATHSDDDQLFFAGLLPTYTARGLRVQVTYFIQHNPTHIRPHELLDGLWHTGVVRYPVISEFPDEYSESAEVAEQNLTEAGYDRESVVAWQTELLRRFRPLVVVGHDVEGEYGHGQHRYNTETLMEAINLSKNPAYHTESLETTGVWDVPRCFLHLYSGNPITLEIDVPLEAFEGRTAFEVSKEAFEFHKSQHNTWFYGWVNVARSTDIKIYSPREYGLYYSANGESNLTDDLFAGLMTYAEREAEEERRVQEALREDAEKIAEQESLVDEAEQNLAELQQDLEETQKSVATVTRTFWIVLISAGAVLTVLIFSFVVMAVKKRKNGEH